MINKSKEEEIDFLNNVIQLIEIKYSEIAESHDNTSKDISDMKKYFWENIEDMDGAEKMPTACRFLMYLLRMKIRLPSKEDWTS